MHKMLNETEKWKTINSDICVKDQKPSNFG